MEQHQEKSIVDRYLSGICYRIIAQEFAIHPSSIRSILIKNDILINRKRVFTLEEEKCVCEHYLKSKNSKVTSTELNIPLTSVARILKRNKIKKRDPKEYTRLYDLDQSCFNNHKDPEVLYWLGMILTDGCIDKGNVIQLGLKLSDIKHIEKFKSFLKTNKPIYHTLDHGIYPQCKISVVSNTIYDKLLSLDITPRKSLTVVPHKDFCNSLDFWRGVIDGDGYIGYHTDGYIRLQIVGSQGTCNKFKQFILDKFGYKINVFKVKDKNLHTISCCGKRAYHILDAIYNGNTALERKEIIVNAFRNSKNKKIFKSSVIVDRIKNGEQI